MCEYLSVRNGYSELKAMVRTPLLLVSVTNRTRPSGNNSHQNFILRHFPCISIDLFRKMRPIFIFLISITHIVLVYSTFIVFLQLNFKFSYVNKTIMLFKKTKFSPIFLLGW